MKAWKRVLGCNCSTPSEKSCELDRLPGQNGWGKLGPREFIGKDIRIVHTYENMLIFTQKYELKLSWDCLSPERLTKSPESDSTHSGGSELGKTRRSPMLQVGVHDSTSHVEENLTVSNKVGISPYPSVSFLEFNPEDTHSHTPKMKRPLYLVVHSSPVCSCDMMGPKHCPSTGDPVSRLWTGHTAQGFATTSQRWGLCSSVEIKSKVCGEHRSAIFCVGKKGK